PTEHGQIKLRNRHVEYRQVASKSARRLRLRVTLSGVEVVKPLDRSEDDVSSFLGQNEQWILDQLKRVERLRKIRVIEQIAGEILFRGERTRVRLEEVMARSRGNPVSLMNGEIVVRRGPESRTPVQRSLENWLRRQARTEIEKHLEGVTTRLRRRPKRV